MPGARAEATRVLWLLDNGKIPDDEPCKLVLPRLEAKKRIENRPDEQGKQKTRLIKELDSHQTYSDFNAQFARYIELTGNPQIAYQIMLELLAALPDDSIRKMAKADEGVINATHSA